MKTETGASLMKVLLSAFKRNQLMDTATGGIILS